jgi:hypothetical protein
MVAVAHPDVERIWQIAEQRRRIADRDGGRSILAVRGRLDTAVEGAGDELHAVADAEDGHHAGKDPRRQGGRAGIVNAGWTSRKDDPLRLQPRDVLLGDVPGEEHAVDPELAHTAGNELAVLATKIEDDDSIEIVGQLGRRASSVGVSESGGRHPCS